MALSLRTAAALAAMPGVRTVIPWGSVEPKTLSMISVTTVGTPSDFRADTAVLGGLRRLTDPRVVHHRG